MGHQPPSSPEIPEQKNNASPLSMKYSNYILFMLTVVYVFNFIDRQILVILHSLGFEYYFVRKYPRSNFLFYGSKGNKRRAKKSIEKKNDCYLQPLILLFNNPNT